MAEYLLDEGLADEVMLVVSPSNPLKDNLLLVPEEHRLVMAQLAVIEAGLADRVEVSDVEFSMPRPSYTIDTIDRLKEEYPDEDFAILVGTDIVGELPKWKEWRKLLSENRFVVYPRPGYPAGQLAESMMLIESAPTWEYSSTEVRDALREGRAEGMIAGSVADYIKQHKLWT